MRPLEILIPIVAVVFICLVIWGSIVGKEQQAEQDRQSYEQCKEIASRSHVSGLSETQSLEWCFKQFQPELK